MRIPIVIYSLFVLIRDVLGFFDQILTHPAMFEQPDSGIVIAALARVSQWIFRSHAGNPAGFSSPADCQVRPFIAPFGRIGCCLLAADLHAARSRTTKSYLQLRLGGDQLNRQHLVSRYG